MNARHTFYRDDALVGRTTATLAAAGHRILQIHKLARTDAAHVAALLALFDPPPGARVLDAGCGIGEVARLMRAQRPDLLWTLLNISPAQLEMCPAGMRKVEGDIEAMPLDDGSVDAVMFNYVLGHADPEKALAEAKRVLRPGGVVFIWDVSARDGAAVLEALGYEPHDFLRLPLWTDLEITELRSPRSTHSADFAALVGPEIWRAFDRVVPVAARLVKR